MGKESQVNGESQDQAPDRNNLRVYRMKRATSFFQVSLI